MKYPHLVSSTTPASLQDWLEEELENRGIDGVYTRYILSLLQEDTIDLEPQDCEHTSLNTTYYKYAEKVEIGEYPLSNSGRSKHQRWKSWGKDKLHGSSNCCCSCGLVLDSEEKKKSAAVECLKAASEQKNGLEKLIDEVCAKLKKINSATGETDEESEGIDIACDELMELLPSSPHEQAEKYYAAFPALTDKLEPLTQLCHQQKSECILNVWDGRKVIECASGKFNRLVRRNEESARVEKTRDDSLDRESNTSEKENSEVQCLDSKHQAKIKTCKFVETSRKENSTIQENQKPLFIVPKMKTPSQRIPFSVKYLPFNQLRNKKISDVSPKIKSDFSLYDECNVAEDPEGNFAFYIEETDSKENIPESREWSPSELSNIKQHEEINEDTKPFSYFDNLCSNCAKFDQMYTVFSDIFKENDIYDDKAELTELASKFNSKLANIWSDYEKDEADIESDSNFLDDSIKFQDKESAGLNNESVWTFKKEDFKRAVQKPKSSLTSHYFSSKDKDSSTDIPSFHSQCFLAPQKLNDIGETVSKSNLCYNLNESDNTGKCCSSSGSSEPSDDNDLANILFDCSKSFNTLNYDTVTPSPNESDRESTSRSSLTGAVKGLHSLWKSESSDSSLVFGMDLEKIWEPSPLEEKSNWMGIPLSDEKYSKILTGADLSDNITYNARRNSKDACELPDSSLSKTKCTLTYHKGESKFVEVIPSRNKGKSESLVISGPNRESLEMECLSVEEEENLLTSPKTHFQPIGHDSLDVETSEDAEVMSLVIKAFESPTDTKESNKDLTEINSCMPIGFENMDSTSALDNAENAKSYSQDSESSLDIVNESTKSQAEEKCIRAVSSSFEELVALTGHFTFEDQEVSKSQEKCEPFRFVPLYTWRTSQYKDKGTNTESVVSPPYDNHSDLANSDDFDFQPFMPLKSDAWSLSPKNKILGMENKQFEWKWSTNDDEDSPWNTVDTLGTWNENILESLSIGSERSKGSGLKCHNLTALRKEIKDEEDELLRDISFLSDDKKNCSVDSSLKEQKKFAFNNKINICDSLSVDLDVKIPSVKHLFSKQESDWDILSSHFSHMDELDSFSGDLYDSCFSISDYDLDEGIATLPQVPADKILYSTDLENEWRKNSQPFDIQVPKRSKIKCKSPPQRRPCSFYLEGNCRRSDCRFSHDLSSITCRFWEEASCFKGVTCPFLHGYPSANNSYQQESGISDCNFTLESEADFPSLSKVNNLDQEFSPSLKASTINKPVRSKRKRNKSYSAGSSEKASMFHPWSQCDMVHNISDEA